jgi:hypothetical protein
MCLARTGADRMRSLDIDAEPGDVRAVGVDGASMVIRYNMGWYEMLLIDIPLLFAATASVANFYMV